MLYDPRDLPGSILQSQSTVQDDGGSHVMCILSTVHAEGNIFHQSDMHGLCVYFWKNVYHMAYSTGTGEGDPDTGLGGGKLDTFGQEH